MRLTAHVEINAPKATVWKAVTDIEGAAARVPAIQKVEVLDRPKTGLVGFKWRETRQMFGKTATEVMWITAAGDGSFYETRAESHGAVYTSRISVTERGGRTVFTMDFEGTPVTFGAKAVTVLMGWMFKGATRRAMQKDLDDIRAAIEGRAAAPQGPV